MAEYLLIESRDPFESNDVGYYYDLARGLVEPDATRAGSCASYAGRQAA
jgi:hypothetical protein